jgi:hypothetical protein
MFYANNVSLGCFCCDVQFCIGFGRHIFQCCLPAEKVVCHWCRIFRRILAMIGINLRVYRQLEISQQWGYYRVKVKVSLCFN